MLAQKDNAIKETCETVYKLNQDDSVRYWCEMREEGHRILRTYESLLKQSNDKLAERDAELAEKNSVIAEKESALAEKDAMIATLQAQLKAYQK